MNSVDLSHPQIAGTYAAPLAAKVLTRLTPPDTQMVRILLPMAIPTPTPTATGPMVDMEDLEVGLALITMATVTELADGLVMVVPEAIVVATFFLLLLAQLLYEKNSSPK